MKIPISIQNRLRGAAVGAAVGDALGMPLEFGPAIPLNRLVRDMRPGPLPAGSFTDDTEMALALAESLLAHRPLDPQDLAERFFDWYKLGPRDIGIFTTGVLKSVPQLGWAEASLRAFQARPDNAANGSLMRCWPVALAYWSDERELIAASRLQSEVTHRHPECVAACVLTNLLIARLAQGQPFEDAFTSVLAISDLPDGLRRIAIEAQSQPRELLKNTGWVRHTLQTALWALQTTSSFEEAVVQAVNLGNDADTGGAVTGALAGAMYGLHAIPTAWRSALFGEWPVSSGTIWSEAHFIALADQLAAGA